MVVANNTREAILNHLKALGYDRADDELVEAILHLGLTTIEILKKNSYMLSAMAEKSNTNRNEINAYVSLLVEKDKDGKYKLICPKKRNRNNKSLVINDKVKKKFQTTYTVRCGKRYQIYQ